MNPFHPLNDDDKLDEMMELAQRVERVTSSGPDVAASFGEEGMTLRSIPQQEYHVKLTEKNAINAWVPSLTYNNESEVFYSGKQVRINSEDPTIWEDVEDGMTWDFAFGNAGGLKERNSNPNVPVGDNDGVVVLAKLERLDSTTPCWVFDYPSPLQQITNIVEQTFNYTDVTINIHTLFPGTGTGTGTGTDDGGGLVIIINDGSTVVIGGPGIWVFNNPVVFNGPVIWNNTFPIDIVTNVCPIPQVGTGTGTSGDQSLKIEKRTIYLPVGTVITDPTCVIDPVVCCYCCDPMPANILYAVVTNIDGCECIPACLILTYDPAHDAWFSTNIGDDCSTTDMYIKLHCDKFTSQWILNIVGGDFSTVLHLPSAITAICEPFSISAQFLNVTDPCTGSFSLVISDEVCEEPVPDPIETTCCENPVPVILNVTVTNKVGCVCIPDSFQMVYDPDNIRGAGWYADPQCDMELQVRLLCTGISANDWELTYDPSDIIVLNEGLSSCDPLSIVFDGAMDSVTTCDGGSARFTVTE